MRQEEIMRDRRPTEGNDPIGFTHDQISSLLGIEPGDVVAVIGAGGKHTLMYRLSEELAAASRSVVLTSTTNLHRSADYARLSTLLTHRDADWRADLPKVLATRRRAVLVESEIGSNLYRGPGPDGVTAIQKVSPETVVLVKADGARKRLLKAPAEYEPVYPPKPDLCVLVLSLAAIGKPFDDRVVHRLERVRTLFKGDTVTPQTLVEIVCGSGGYADRLPPAARNVLYLSACNSGPALQAAQYVADGTGNTFHLKICGDTIDGTFHLMKQLHARDQS